MNKKGFTLIELIATVTVMGIIILVAVPNITSIVEKNKRSGYVNDAKKLVTLAKYKFQTENARPNSSNGNTITYCMNSLDTSDLGSPPNDGTYDLTHSFVQIKYVNQEYIYLVQLVEKYSVDGKTYYRGLVSNNSEDLYKENAKMTLVGKAYESFGGSPYSATSSC